ncbi:hypothetical protein MTO96_016717 [Rhipicephalus appendiculatus]
MSERGLARAARPSANEKRAAPSYPGPGLRFAAGAAARSTARQSTRTRRPIVALALLGSTSPRNSSPIRIRCGRSAQTSQTSTRAAPPSAAGYRKFQPLLGTAASADLSCRGRSMLSPRGGPPMHGASPLLGLSRVSRTHLGSLLITTSVMLHNFAPPTPATNEDFF